MLMIKSGILYNGTQPCDVLIENGRIMRVEENITTDKPCDVIDANGLVIAPGLVDVHAHFRDPGFAHKEDVASGANAAKRGGYTSVVLMANTKPCVDNPETLRYVLEAGRQTGINVYSVAAVTRGLAGAELVDMQSLAAAGAVGFSDDGMPLMDTAMLKAALEAAARLKLPVSLHEENPELIGTAGVNAGDVAARLGLVGASRESETMMVARDCTLALETGARVHIQHLSCAESVEAVRLAKKRGAAVTAEVTPQHLALTEQAVLEKGTLAKLNPPFRTEADRLALIAGLKDGTIDMIATDHAPHTAEEKAKPFAQAPSGVIGLETALALCITKLVREKHLTLPEVIDRMATAPARLYGLESGIAIGKRADLCIFDAEESFAVKNEFASKSANLPFIGERLYGAVKYTICGGKAVYQEGKRNG